MILHRLVKNTDRYGLSKEDISFISSLSALHDIGKITVAEGILNKPGKLTTKEWEIMKAHTVNGDSILDSASNSDDHEKLMQIAHEIVRSHHERWDGSGYPDGLSGDMIPISAQVVSIADVYDALTSNRCYKKAFSHETAVRMICEGECGSFNPLLTECFRDIEPELYSKSFTDSGEDNLLDDATDMADEMLAQ